MEWYWRIPIDWEIWSLGKNTCHCMNRAHLLMGSDSGVGIGQLGMQRSPAWRWSMLICCVCVFLFEGTSLVTSAKTKASIGSFLFEGTRFFLGFASV